MTDKQTWSTMDKSTWGIGPWLHEPDKLSWADPETELPCLIVRNRMGGLCGYVAVPPDHPFHGVGYSDCPLPTATTRTAEEVRCPGLRDRELGGCHAESNYCQHEPEANIDVHGGLTYSGECQKGPISETICHPVEGEVEGKDSVWWFGFDCGHYMDGLPGFQPLAGETVGYMHPNHPDHNGTYRDLAYVTAEVTRLASQLDAIGSKGGSQ